MSSTTGRALKGSNLRSSQEPYFDPAEYDLETTTCGHGALNSKTACDRFMLTQTEANREKLCSLYTCGTANSSAWTCDHSRATADAGCSDIVSSGSGRDLFSAEPILR
jgi:hypothetical protein